MLIFVEHEGRKQTDDVRELLNREMESIGLAAGEVSIQKHVTDGGSNMFIMGHSEFWEPVFSF